MAATTSQRTQAKLDQAAHHAQINGNKFADVPYTETASSINLDPLENEMFKSLVSQFESFQMPSWKKWLVTIVSLVAIGVAGYFIGPVIASVLVTGAASLTANTFVLWCADILGYFIAMWGASKLTQLVTWGLSKVVKLD